MLALRDTESRSFSEINVPQPDTDDGHILLFATDAELRQGRAQRPPGPVKILVVEGWAGDYQLLVENLRDVEATLALTWVDRAEKALDLLCTESGAEQPDILLIDPVLPGTDGWEVLEELREQGCGEDLAIVVQASARSDYLLQRCGEFGVEAAVEKPLAAESFRTLLATLGFRNL